MGDTAGDFADVADVSANGAAILQASVVAAVAPGFVADAAPAAADLAVAGVVAPAELTGAAVANNY
jgi:hypothetical protein